MFYVRLLISGFFVFVFMLNSYVSSGETTDPKNNKCLVSDSTSAFDIFDYEKYQRLPYYFKSKPFRDPIIQGVWTSVLSLSPQFIFFISRYLFFSLHNPRMANRLTKVSMSTYATSLQRLIEASQEDEGKSSTPLDFYNREELSVHKIKFDLAKDDQLVAALLQEFYDQKEEEVYRFFLNSFKSEELRKLHTVFSDFNSKLLEDFSSMCIEDGSLYFQVRDMARIMLTAMKDQYHEKKEISEV